MSAELRAKAMATGSRPSSLRFYRLARGLLRWVVNPVLSAEAVNPEILDRPGATILAPVHRSHLDSPLIATFSHRRIRALGKESLFTTPVVGWVCAALGAIPVRRGHADRDAMGAARELLDAGETMIVFPEGGRGSGERVGELYDGAAWLAARTGAPIVPIGIAGTEEVLPEGARLPRRSKVVVVVGEPIPAPVADGRVPRRAISAHTRLLAERLQQAQDDAVARRAGR
ncbi:MAG: lysophospholipid acyltransferase family protein [Acidimicrobiales bacterium]